jgi:hypothetical protein
VIPRRVIRARVRDDGTSSARGREEGRKEGCRRKDQVAGDYAVKFSHRPATLVNRESRKSPSFFPLGLAFMQPTKRNSFRLSAGFTGLGYSPTPNPQPPPPYPLSLLASAYNSRPSFSRFLHPVEGGSQERNGRRCFIPEALHPNLAASRLFLLSSSLFPARFFVAVALAREGGDYGLFLHDPRKEPAGVTRMTEAVVRGGSSRS